MPCLLATQSQSLLHFTSSSILSIRQVHPGTTSLLSLLNPIKAATKLPSSSVGHSLSYATPHIHRSFVEPLPFSLIHPYQSTPHRNIPPKSCLWKDQSLRNQFLVEAISPYRPFGVGTSSPVGLEGLPTSFASETRLKGGVIIHQTHPGGGYSIRRSAITVSPALPSSPRPRIRSRKQ